ncbi:MAG TPA: poly-gamma-glutamate biosynthesis protein [Gammaproteobacteria bacterium]|nr:poly-gamma-glutamate biosynthesis protein [Gammaproteobacteria bacterium]
MRHKKRGSNSEPVTLFLCGDVMTGRGIDQILPYPSSPEIYEPYMTSARGYVKIAEETNGPIPAPAAFDYIWGDALTELNRIAPDLRLINLETAVTRSDAYWPRKGINYRMHPDNFPCIESAGIDACILANNHVLDWGYEGLDETLATVDAAGIKRVGAGENSREAGDPAVFELTDGRRVVVLAFAHPSSGVPPEWRAGPGRAGVFLIESLNDAAIEKVASQVTALKQQGDLVVASIHWGGNWGYSIPREQQRFAHGLIDRAGVDVVHGHSSHHPRGIEIYNDRPILYGCGDFLNDYEGIRSHSEYRGDLALMYFLTLDPCNGSLLRLQMTPMQIRRFRLQRPSKQDQQWLAQTMDRECRRLGTRLRRNAEGRFELSWQ